MIPTKPTRREKSAAVKQRVIMPLHRWKAKDWEAFRSKNPYVVPVAPRWTTVQFRNEMQVRIVHELFEHNKNRYAKQWTIDLDHWRNNLEYFGEALALCEEFDLVKLMSVNCDFDVQLIHQFYATVHFGEDDARTLTFMCRDELFQVPWRTFCNAIGYDDTGLEGRGGIRPHDHPESMPKEKLAPLYIRGRGIIGESKDLVKVYDIMHRVFRNVLLPKVGNQDEIHGYLVDLMVAMKTKVGSGETFDVSNWLWHEMYNMVIYRKVPIYAPFVMCFLNSVWGVRRPGEPLTSPDNLTNHEVKLLKKKKHAEPRFPANAPEDVYATSDDEDFELEPGAKPSWVDKLAAKVKKTFCLQSDIQKRMYEAHVNEKLARRRQIAMMRHLSMSVQSGSEKSITPEERWISSHSTWTDDEAPPQPSTTVTAADDIMEDSDRDDDEVSDDGEDSDNDEDLDATEESEEDD